jgi:hypothetical protein
MFVLTSDFVDTFVAVFRKRSDRFHLGARVHRISPARNTMSWKMPYLGELAICLDCYTLGFLGCSPLAG